MLRYLVSQPIVLPIPELTKNSTYNAERIDAYLENCSEQPMVQTSFSRGDLGPCVRRWTLRVYSDVKCRPQPRCKHGMERVRRRRGGAASESGVEASGDDGWDDEAEEIAPSSESWPCDGTVPVHDSRTSPSCVGELRSEREDDPEVYVIEDKSDDGLALGKEPS